MTAPTTAQCHQGSRYPSGGTALEEGNSSGKDGDVSAAGGGFGAYPPQLQEFVNPVDPKSKALGKIGRVN